MQNVLECRAFTNAALVLAVSCVDFRPSQLSCSLECRALGHTILVVVVNCG